MFARRCFDYHPICRPVTLQRRQDSGGFLCFRDGTIDFQIVHNHTRRIDDRDMDTVRRVVFHVLLGRYGTQRRQFGPLGDFQLRHAHLSLLAVFHIHPVHQRSVSGYPAHDISIFQSGSLGDFQQLFLQFFRLYALFHGDMHRTESRYRHQGRGRKTGATGSFRALFSVG